MLISELIKQLENIRQEHGNIHVCIQYSDAGGDYDGAGDFELFYDKRNLLYLETTYTFNDREDYYPAVEENKSTILDFNRQISCLQKEQSDSTE